MPATPSAWHVLPMKRLATIAYRSVGSYENSSSRRRIRKLNDNDSLRSGKDGFFVKGRYMTVYWFMGLMSNVPSKLTFFVGFYKSIQSAGAARIWYADVVKILYIVHFRMGSPCWRPRMPDYQMLSGKAAPYTSLKPTQVPDDDDRGDGSLRNGQGAGEAMKSKRVGVERGPPGSLTASDNDDGRYQVDGDSSSERLPSHITQRKSYTQTSLDKQSNRTSVLIGRAEPCTRPEPTREVSSSAEITGFPPSKYENNIPTSFPRQTGTP
ncbi:hypothetical protein EDD85DRAFT_786020 [Armillaria nabsnona]|nr:hypothetical protein EDD85DRAFT_786020 [Armillaria nabsnona]